MTRFIETWIAALLVTFIASAFAPQAAAEQQHVHYASVADGYAANRPVAWWRLKEPPGEKVAADVTGRHDGKYYDGAPDFDGDLARVAVGTFDIDAAQLTILAWFRADDFDTHDARIISKATGTDVDTHYWMLSTVEHQKQPRLRLRVKAGGKTSELVSSAATPAERWVFAAAVYDGKTMTIYQNGERVGKLKKKGRLDTNAHAHVWIGDNPSGPGSRPFDGRIENVALFDRALSAAAIKAIYLASDAAQPLAKVQKEAPPAVVAARPLREVTPHPAATEIEPSKAEVEHDATASTAVAAAEPANPMEAAEIDRAKPPIAPNLKDDVPMVARRPSKTKPMKQGGKAKPTREAPPRPPVPNADGPPIDPDAPPKVRQEVIDPEATPKIAETGNEGSDEPMTRPTQPQKQAEVRRTSPVPRIYDPNVVPPPPTVVDPPMHTEVSPSDLVVTPPAGVPTGEQPDTLVIGRGEPGHGVLSGDYAAEHVGGTIIGGVEGCPPISAAMSSDCPPAVSTWCESPVIETIICEPAPIIYESFAPVCEFPLGPIYAPYEVAPYDIYGGYCP